MQQKRGQAAIFFILIVLVLLIIVFVLYTNFAKIKTQADQQRETTDTLAFTTDAVVSFAQSCIDLISIEAAYAVAFYGGHASPHNTALSTNVQGEDYRVTLSLDSSGANTLPSVDEIAQQMEIYIENNVPRCANGYADFPDFEVNEGAVQASVTINQEDYVANVEYPISVKDGSSVTDVQEFSPAQVPIRIKHVRDIANEIVEQLRNDPENINIGYLLSLNDDNMQAVYVPRDKNLIFIIHDITSSILRGSVQLNSDFSNRQFLFVFGANFDWHQATETQFDEIAEIMDLS